VAEFRIGIPSGLTTGSVASDSYSRQIVRASTTQAGGVSTVATQTTYTDTTADATQLSAKGWGVYSGTHTLPATGWAGIKNVGFYGITSSSSNAGNNLDSITLGLKPVLDLGSSRDRSAGEAFTPQALKIRVNGRVAAGAKIALVMASGDATPDADFTIGSVTSAFGTATVTHTSGDSTWVIEIPAGDYDGGVNAATGIGYLTVPILYTADAVTESDEYVLFELSDLDADGRRRCRGCPAAEDHSVDVDARDGSCRAGEAVLAGCERDVGGIASAHGDRLAGQQPLHGGTVDSERQRHAGQAHQLTRH
jgi:hypothetical protein